MRDGTTVESLLQMHIDQKRWCTETHGQGQQHTCFSGDCKEESPLGLTLQLGGGGLIDGLRRGICELFKSHYYGSAMQTATNTYLHPCILKFYETIILIQLFCGLWFIYLQQVMSSAGA